MVVFSISSSQVELKFVMVLFSISSSQVELKLLLN